VPVQTHILHITGSKKHDVNPYNTQENGVGDLCQEVDEEGDQPQIQCNVPCCRIGLKGTDNGELTPQGNDREFSEANAQRQDVEEDVILEHENEKCSKMVEKLREEVPE
jgi:hypothetical protein